MGLLAVSFHWRERQAGIEQRDVAALTSIQLARDPRHLRVVAIPGGIGFELPLEVTRIERRQARFESELAAAAVAQRWILPKRLSTACGFCVTGESRPGAYVGGDFFDVIPLSDTKLAVALGDVTGHGIAASVLMTAAQGSDPASLAFEAMDRAARDGADLLLIDTAGRLQNRQDLMEELAKIVRVIRKRDPSAPHNTLLVLDATTGQNALSQVEIFQKIADVTGLVMTKLDGTAKGGVLVALADRFGLPIHAIGVGEQIDDLAPFDPEEFARALTGAA